MNDADMIKPNEAASEAGGTLLKAFELKGGNVHECGKLLSQLFTAAYKQGYSDCIARMKELRAAKNAEQPETD